MVIYLGYGVWHSSERRSEDTQVILHDDADKDNNRWRCLPVMLTMMMMTVMSLQRNYTQKTRGGSSVVTAQATSV